MNYDTQQTEVATHYEASTRAEDTKRNMPTKILFSAITVTSHVEEMDGLNTAMNAVANLLTFLFRVMSGLFYLLDVEYIE